MALGPVQASLRHTWTSSRGPLTLLAQPERWATIDYRSITHADVAGDVRWTSVRSGVAHGLLVWFDSTLVDGVELSNHPDRPKLVYGRAFFPWPEPVALAPGDVVDVAFRADLVNDEYLWQWTSSVSSAASGGRREFRQSTFLGVPLGLDQLKRRGEPHVPTLAGEGEILKLALVSMDGTTTLGAVAARLADRFPGRFSSWSDALAYVGELSLQYGRR